MDKADAASNTATEALPSHLAVDMELRGSTEDILTEGLEGNRLSRADA